MDPLELAFQSQYLLLCVHGGCSLRAGPVREVREQSFWLSADAGSIFSDLDEILAPTIEEYSDRFATLTLRQMRVSSFFSPITPRVTVDPPPPSLLSI